MMLQQLVYTVTTYTYHLFTVINNLCTQKRPKIIYHPSYACTVCIVFKMWNKIKLSRYFWTYLLALLIVYIILAQNSYEFVSKRDLKTGYQKFLINYAPRAISGNLLGDYKLSNTNQRG